VTSDGAADREAAATTDAGPCTDSLDNVSKTFGDCPATFDGNLGTFFCPTTVLSQRAAGIVEDKQVIFVSWLTHGKACVYGLADAGSALVGAIAFDDVPSFCARTSPQVNAGAIPSACINAACNLTDLGTCSPADAGTD
jgi:hypothetical protein